MKRLWLPGISQYESVKLGETADLAILISEAERAVEKKSKPDSTI